jgi:hypothetical protein
MTIDLSDPIYHDEDAARRHLEETRWSTPEERYCPLPECGIVGKSRPLLGDSMGPGWFYCAECHGKFTVRTGTVYERSHVALHKWILAFRLLASSKKGMSSRELSRSLNVSYKTAWFMGHRIREAMTEHNPEPLGGKDKVVEADETFHGPADYVFVNGKGWQQKRGTVSKRKIMSLVERGGRSISVKVEELNIQTVKKVLGENVVLDSALHTDEAQHYKAPGRNFAKHEAVNHSAGEYVRGTVTTNTVEGFFSIFKRGMVGTYQHCGEQHLQRYLCEFDFRYSNRAKLGIDDTERTAKAIKGADGKRLTYRRLNKRAA